MATPDAVQAATELIEQRLAQEEEKEVGNPGGWSEKRLVCCS